MINKNPGLTESEVLESRKKYGTNRINKKKKDTIFKLLFETLSDPIIRILLVALIIKTIFLFRDFDWYETLGIVIAILVTSFISSISEYGSSKAFERLEEEASKIKVKVIRNGVKTEINIEDIVKGELVVLETGDKIPADGHIIEGGISVDESAINGETKEKTKTINGDNKVYRGTIVYSNSAKMEVTEIGENTFYGKIAAEIQEDAPVSPLKGRLTKLARTISRIGYIGAVLVSISYLFSVIVIHNNFDPKLIMATISNFGMMSGYLLYALTLSVTIIVVAVPEGLPMMITLVLSSNMKRMLKSNILVRKLVGIETAGSINILYTDKTGTLTKGKLEVVGIINKEGKEFTSLEQLKRYSDYHQMVVKSMLYNNESSYNINENRVIGGNSTDRALLNFIKGLPSDNIKVLEKKHFDSTNKYSSVTIEDKVKIKLIKGSPEKLLPLCTSYYNLTLKKEMLINKESIEKQIKDITKMGIRVLLMASTTSTVSKELSNLTYIGLVLIKDEVRKEAIEGVELVKKAGISVVMITGDNIDTATSIAKETGIVSGPNDIIITSTDLNKLSDFELKKIIPNLKVVARSLPNDKSRLVKISSELGLVVGMTGDGVNDAPALKKADIGFAMGSGTEVAKESSDIVILDDNFLSISKAILFGRTIFKSIRKFIIFQLTVNLCAIFVSLIGPFIDIATPVTVIQMLWINMVMDTLAGVAFSYEPPLKEYMQEQPKKKNENIVNRYMVNEIVVTGLYASLMCMLFLIHPFFKKIYITEASLMTAFFGLFIFLSIFNSFNARTHRLNIFAHLDKNKIFLCIIAFIVIVQLFLLYFGGTVFRTIGLSFKEFYLMILLSITIIPFDFLRKYIIKYRKKVTGV